MEKQEKRLGNQWDMELVHRITNIKENSATIKEMTKRDYIVAGIIIVLCLCAIIAGAFIPA